MKKTVVFVFLAIVMILSAPAFAEDVVKFGVCEIRSGAFKSNGDRMLVGIEAAVKEINDAGGLLGKKVELVVEDNQGKGEVAVQKVKKLILDDKCEVIIQGSNSGVGGAIAQAMPRYKKIYLDTNAEAMGITGENFTPYTFRTCMNAGMHTKSLAQYFAAKGFKKVFLINQDYSWGHDVAAWYEKAIKAISPDTQIVGNEFHPVFNKDFAPYISKIQAAGADYIISGNWGTDLTQLIVQSRNLGLNIPIGCTFMDDPGVMAIAQTAAKDCVTSNTYILGVDNPKAKEMEENFHKLSDGHNMDFVTYMAYMGTKWYIQVIQEAGTFEIEKVIEAFEKSTFDGPVGAVTMRAEDHQAQTPAVIAEYAEKTPYYDHPYIKPVEIIPAEKVSLTPEESGWQLYKGK
jgi:branched-chain amino acid transport system substrate-binding protein